LCDIDGEALAETVSVWHESLQDKAGQTIFSSVFDIRKQEEISRFIDDAGDIDVLVHVAWSLCHQVGRAGVREACFI